MRLIIEYAILGSVLHLVDRCYASHSTASHLFESCNTAWKTRGAIPDLTKWLVIEQNNNMYSVTSVCRYALRFPRPFVNGH